jgi:hypothetical protein
MASVNAPLATSGFVGAITSVIVGLADKIVPDSTVKALVAVGSGMVAALLSFEMMSWYVILRLRTTKGALDNIIPQFEKIQGQIQTAIERQVEIMKNQHASEKSLRDTERELNDLSGSIIKAMIEINKKSLDIIRSLES